MSTLIDRARELGHEVGALEGDLLVKDPESPLVPHDRRWSTGEAVGNLMAQAYKQGGAADAAKVLAAYIDAYNAERISRGLSTIPDATMLRNQRWVAPNTTDSELEEIRRAFPQNPRS